MNMNTVVGRITALEHEVYMKRADKEYFGNDAIWFIFLGVLAFAFLIMWIKS